MEAVSFNEWMAPRVLMSLCDWKLSQPFPRAAQDAGPGGTHSVGAPLLQAPAGQLPCCPAPIAAPRGHEAKRRRAPLATASVIGARWEATMTGFYLNL